MVEIKLVRHQLEIDQLVDLFRVAFGQQMSKKLWEWKYITNPFVAADTEVVAAVDNNKIVGVRPFLMTELWINNEKTITAQHCDTMVHPDYRNIGLFNRMGIFARDYLKANQIPLSYGFPGPMSRSGFLKQGYRKVASTEIMFRPVNTGRIIAARFARKRTISVIADFFGSALTPNIPASQKNTGSFEIEVLDRYSDALQGLDGLRNPGVIEYVRDKKSLTWRFDQHPHHLYRYILAKRKGKLSAYAAISVQEQPNNLMYGMVIDYLVGNGDVDCFRVVIEKAMIELAKTGCDVIVIWAFNDPVFCMALKKHLGFKSTAQFPFNKFIDHGYFDVLGLDDLCSNLDVYNEDQWRITYAYPDFT